MLLCRLDPAELCAYYVHDAVAQQCHFGNHDEAGILSADPTHAEDAWAFKGGQ